ncbi:MAG TPA: SRPBCC domain-containing protein [Puia sp.]|nr:SRPBCC domain-containing protein [Puia sp.]
METTTTTTYTTSIEVPQSPQTVFRHITNDLPQWWPEDVAGETTEQGDEFTFTTGDSHYSKNRIIELHPGKKVVWLVTESIRKTDNFDWSGTKMSFELTPNGANTRIEFTYDGVVLENEKGRLAQICDLVTKELLYNFILNNNSYTASIELTKSPEHVFKAITDVSKWWGGKDFEGSSKKLNEEFTIHHPGSHYSIQKLVEVIENKRVVWLVTKGQLHWLKTDQYEWTGTRMIFEITGESSHGGQGTSSTLHFTHAGLTPAKESFEKCSQGWNMVITDWLYHFIEHGVAHF